MTCVARAIPKSKRASRKTVVRRRGECEVKFQAPRWPKINRGRIFPMVCQHPTRPMSMMRSPLYNLVLCLSYWAISPLATQSKGSPSCPGRREKSRGGGHGVGSNRDEGIVGLWARMCFRGSEFRTTRVATTVGGRLHEKGSFCLAFCLTRYRRLSQWGPFLVSLHRYSSTIPRRIPPRCLVARRQPRSHGNRPRTSALVTRCGYK